MALADDYSPAPGRLYGTPQVDVGPLYVPTLDYAVLGVRQTERFPPDGRRIPTIETTFAVPGVPGTFTLMIDNYAFSHADVLGYLRGRSWRIRRLMALPADLEPRAEEF